MPGVWFTNGGNIDYTPATAQFAIAEVEGTADYDGLMLAVNAGALPNCPLAIVTNHGGLIVKDANGDTDIAASRARAKPLVDAGFTCINELYLRNDAGVPTGVTAETMAFVAHAHLGFDFGRISETFGIFGGATRADYAAWHDNLGNSDYVVEAVLG